MKRPMTLTASILGTVMHALYTISELIMFALVIDLMGGSSVDSSSTIVIVAMVIAMLLSIVSLVFNALSIPSWNKSPAIFRKKRGLVITAIVFNFIVVLLILISCFTSAVGVLDVILMLVIVASSVLYIVDLSIEKKRVEKLEELNAVVVQPEVKNTTSDLEDKIEKLNNMKANGLITDEEYNQLKKDYIQQKLNG